MNTVGSGSISVTGLSVQAGGAVSLTGPNKFLHFAMSAGGTGTSTISNGLGFHIRTMGSISGIANSVGTTVLNAGPVTQDAPISTANLAPTGDGPFELSLATNTIGTLAASTRAVELKNNGPLTIGTIGLIDGITTTTGGVSLAGTGVTLTASDITFGAPINAGTGTVSLFPLSSNTPVVLAGAAQAGSWNISLAELNAITSGALVIGTPGSTASITIGGAFTRSGSLSLSGSAITGGGITVPNLTLNATGAITLNGDVDFLSITNNAASASNVYFYDGDGFALGIPSTSSALAPTDFSQVYFPTVAGTVIFRPEETLSLSISTAAHDRILVDGGVILNTQLILNAVGTLPNAREFVLLVNDGADAISGTFAGLPEGATIPDFNPPTTISYHGGDGNDVSIRTASVLGVAFAVNGKTATFTDVDGDFVTVKTTVGTLGLENFTGFETGTFRKGQLQTLTLGAGFAGAAITITAKPGSVGGNGFVNIGFIDATSVDLAAVTVAGDLGRIHAGTVGGDVKVPALKSLTVQSIGLLGTSTQVSGGTLLSDIQGALGKLTVKGDLRGELSISNVDGSLGGATIGGSIGGATSQAAGIFAAAGIGSVKVGGDIRAEGDTYIKTAGPLGTVAIGGSIVGQPNERVHIEGFGQRVAPTKGVDLGIKSITVKGSVEFTTIAAGGVGSNADASIGSISIGGDWIASNAIAGFYSSGVDTVLFTNDDQRAVTPVRNVAGILASIGRAKPSAQRA